MKKKILASIQIACFIAFYGFCGTMDVQENLDPFPFLIYVAITALIFWLAYEAGRTKERIVYMDRPVVEAAPMREWRDINCYAERVEED